MGIADRGELVMLDLFLKRIEGGEIMRRIVAMCEEWDCTAFVEANATSNHLLSIMQEAGIPFRTVEPGSQDKWTRAQDAVALWERHRVLIPQRADWLESFERQVYNFEPKGSDDDAVDCLAYAARVMRDEFTSPGLFAPPQSERPREFLPRGIAASGRPPGFERR